MKENVFDVLIYLFEMFMAGETEDQPNQDQVRTNLLEAGFPQPEIAKALDWLDTMEQQQVIRTVSSPAFRVFSVAEQARLDTESQGLLIYLEQCEILTPATRELVIDRIMAIDEEQFSSEYLRWMILMVLYNLPNEQLAFARMEHFVYGSPTACLH